MRFVGLVSGGKDSVYAISKLLGQGDELVGLVYVRSREYRDSYMFQTTGAEIASLFGECFGVPLLIHDSACKSINTELAYRETEEDEVEDLCSALRELGRTVQFEAVCSGAILSRYQKNRVEEVCGRLGLMSLAPLWGREQRKLLAEMIQAGVDARIIKVASPVLGKECVGMRLEELMEYLDAAGAGMHYCGEGGEYETVVLDCGCFRQRIKVGGISVRRHPEDRNRDSGVYFGECFDVELVSKEES